MAAFAANLPKNAGRTSLIVTIDGNSFTLCSLNVGAENQPLNFFISENEEVTFSLVGPCPVDITGNIIVMLPPNGMEEDDDFDEEIESDEELSMDDEDLAQFSKEDLQALNDRIGDDEEELTAEEIALIKEKLRSLGNDEELSSDDEDDEEMEFDEEILASVKRKAEPIPVNNKKAKITEIVDEDEESQDEDSEVESEEETAASAEVVEPVVVKKQLTNKERKAQKEAEAQKAKETPKEKPVPKEKVDKENQDEPKVKKLPSGLIMEDNIIGTGPKAKAGKKVSVRYIGKLTNGKTFDSNTKGAPFSFKLGKGDVIKGWDMGIQGMSVGGTRKLTIPPSLAYGSKGAAPDIPKNATLVFEVKLLAVK